MQANDAESAALSHTQWCLKKVTGSSRDTSHLFYFWLGCTSKLTPRRMVMKSIHAKFIPGNVSSSKNGRTCRQTYTQSLLKLQCQCCSKVIWNDTLDFYAACIINLEITINWVLVHFLFFLSSWCFFNRCEISDSEGRPHIVPLAIALFIFFKWFW